MSDVQLEEFDVKVDGVEARVCIASDTGDDRISLMHEMILPLMDPEDARIALVAEVTSAIISGGEHGDSVALAMAILLQRLYPDAEEFDKIMLMIGETKAAWDAGQRE